MAMSTKQTKSPNVSRLSCFPMLRLLLVMMQLEESSDHFGPRCDYRPVWTLLKTAMFGAVDQNVEFYLTSQLLFGKNGSANHHPTVTWRLSGTFTRFTHPIWFLF